MTSGTELLGPRDGLSFLLLMAMRWDAKARGELVVDVCYHFIAAVESMSDNRTSLEMLDIVTPAS